MNERIKELELEAIAYADSKVPANDRYNDIYHSIVRGKFAELLIKECCAQVERQYKYATKQTSTWSMSQDIQDMLTKHFGVEE